MQKVKPTSVIPSAQAQSTINKNATPLQHAVDFLGAKYARITDLQAEIRDIQSSIKGSDEETLLRATLEKEPANATALYKGIDYSVEASEKRMVSKVDSEAVTKALLADGNEELLIKLASYTQADLKKYVDNWDGFVDGDKTGARTINYKAMSQDG